MIHTTFAKAKEAGACESSYKKMGEAMGGITSYGKDTPIPLDKVLETLGLQDTIWAMRCTIEPSEGILVEFACRCAEHVLPFFADKYPDDKRPQQAIDAARVCITDKSPDARAAAWAARDAAWAAARAARDAARDATRAAAWAAWAAAGAAAWAADGDAWAAWAAAGAAARDAAWAAWAAAGAAAWAAAGDAEKEWQAETLRELLNKGG